MEIFLQYWDDLDDLLGVLGLVAERIRRILLFTLSALFFFAVVATLVVVSLAKPPLALAFATLLAVSLLYRSVTSPHPRRRAA